MRSGDVIAGRYRLEDALGTGGMGEVWRATDLELRRGVALKLANSGDGEETRREARIGAGLHHPNVIAVFDVVVDDDRRWLVMEYIQARSLADILREDGPIAPDRATNIGRQIAAALSAMHAKGMVHRDIKPANILVTDDGTAKLADLGIAMWDMVTLTGSAKDAGTSGYVAPEVIEGHRATPASDMYSLGVTLSVAVEGHPETDGRMVRVLALLTDTDPARRPTADRTTLLLGGSSARRIPRRVLVAASIGVAALTITAVIVVPGSDATPSRPVVPARPAGDAKLLYGVGDRVNTALASELVRDTPVRMLTTNYHKPDDLPELTSWQNTLVPDAYAKGYALHLVVADWDNEVPFETTHGTACGRKHPLTPEFLEHMRTLARAFAGRADDPPLYVTMFRELSNFACGANGMYADLPSTTAYYEALKERYLEVMQIFHAEAPNAKVALGWQVWQSSIDDDPETGAGRSMFKHFADVLEASDFQSILAKQPHGNIDQVRRSVRILGEYGPVMMSAYGDKEVPGEVVEEDMRELLTDESLADLTRHRLFAWNFNDEGVLARAGRPTVDYVKEVVDRTGQRPR